MARLGKWGQSRSTKKGTFDPHDTKRVKHTRLGVWDLYEERDSRFAHIPWSSNIEHYLKTLQDLSYVWSLLKDILIIPGCWYMLSLYMILELVGSILPALRLW